MFVCTVPLCHIVGLWVYTGLVQGVQWGWYVDSSLSFALLSCWFLWCRVSWGFGTVWTRKKGILINEEVQVWGGLYIKTQVASKSWFTWLEKKHILSITYSCILSCRWFKFYFVSLWDSCFLSNIMEVHIFCLQYSQHWTCFKCLLFWIIHIHWQHVSLFTISSQYFVLWNSALKTVSGKTLLPSSIPALHDTDVIYCTINTGFLYVF